MAQQPPTDPAHLEEILRQLKEVATEINEDIDPQLAAHRDRRRRLFKQALEAKVTAGELQAATGLSSTRISQLRAEMGYGKYADRPDSD